MSKNFIAVTFTTSGYTNFTLNLIQSIKENNVDLDLKVYCLDKQSFDVISKNHNNAEFFNSEHHDGSNKLLKFDPSGNKENPFNKIMISKFEIIHTSLNNFDNVLYVDSDIVIKKNIENKLLSSLDRKDILFQNDKRPSKPNQINLCAGFMLIKKNKKTLNFFNPEKLPIEKIIGYVAHDQTYINRNKAKFNYGVLPLDDFPNGPHFYNNKDKLSPYIIHFNFLLGENKQDEMKKYNEWYI